MAYDDYDNGWDKRVPQSVGGGGVSDGDKGDIVVSGGGATWNIDTAYKPAFHWAPFANATYDLGVPTTNEWRNLYLAGNANIYFNGSTNERITHVVGTGLRFVNGEKIMERASAASNAPLRVLNNFDASGIQVAIFEGDRATPAANDDAYVSFRLSDSAGNQDAMFRLGWFALDHTSASEDSCVYGSTVKAGTLATAIAFTQDYFEVRGDSIWMRAYSALNNFYIRDNGYNEVLQMQGVASAVNHVKITSAATGNDPLVEAVGDDTNIDLAFIAKGTGLLDMRDGQKWTNIISPAQITANQNDYAPTGYESCGVMRINSDAYRTITSIAGGVDGRLLLIENVGSFQIDLEDQTSALGTAANRIITPNGGWVPLATGTSVLLRYDGTSSRWRAVMQFSAANQAQMEAANNNTVFVTAARAHYHPGVCKCWGQTTGAGTPALTTSYNMTSITDTAVGRLTVTIATDFSSANWAGTATAVCATNANRMCALVSKAAGSVILESSSATTTLADPGVGWDWAFYGDHA